MTTTTSNRQPGVNVTERVFLQSDTRETIREGDQGMQLLRTQSSYGYDGIEMRSCIAIDRLLHCGTVKVRSNLSICKPHARLSARTLSYLHDGSLLVKAHHPRVTLLVRHTCPAFSIYIHLSEMAGNAVAHTVLAHATLGLELYNGPCLVTTADYIEH